MRKTLMTVLFVVAIAACGGKSQPAPEGGGGERLAEGAEPGHEHPELPPELDAFHEMLAPLWHAEAGPEREANTCAAEAKFEEVGLALENAVAPDGLDANAWQTEVLSLRAAVDTMIKGCGEPGFEERFTAVHDGFHALTDLLKTRGPAV